MKNKLCVLLGISVLTFLSFSCKSIDGAGGSGLSAIVLKTGETKFPKTTSNLAVYVWPTYEQTGCDAHPYPLEASRPLVNSSNTPVQNTLSVDVEGACKYSIQMMYWCANKSGRLEACYESDVKEFTSDPVNVTPVTLIFHDYKTNEIVDGKVSGEVGPKNKVGLEITTVYQGENKMTSVGDFIQRNNLVTLNANTNVWAKTREKNASILYDLGSNYYFDRGWYLYSNNDKSNLTGLMGLDVNNDHGKSIITNITVDGKTASIDQSLPQDANEVSISICELKETIHTNIPNLKKDNSGACYTEKTENEVKDCEGFCNGWFAKCPKNHGESGFQWKNCNYKTTTTCTYLKKVSQSCQSAVNTVSKCTSSKFVFKRQGT